MSEHNTRHGASEPRRYADDEGNTYAVERSVKTGRWIVARVNPGGNRKMAKRFPAVKSQNAAQRMLDAGAAEQGWKEIGA